MEFIKCGKLVNTYGLKGDLKVLSDSDFKDERYKVGNTLFVEFKGEKIELKISQYKVHNGADIIKFEGFNDINQVEKYKGCDVYIPMEQLSELEDDEFYYFELIGCNVYTEENEHIGTIERIMETGANDVWVIKRKSGKNVLIPYIDQVVKEVDIEAKKVIIHAMAGLLD